MENSRQSEHTRNLNADLIVGIFSLGLGAIVFFSTRGLSRLGGVFVDYVLIALSFLSIITIAKGFIKPERIRFFESTVERNNVLAGILILFFYLIFLPLAGFLPSSYAFYFLFNLYLADDRFKTKNIVSSFFLTLIVVTAFYFIFHYILQVPLPQGEWFK